MKIRPATSADVPAIGQLGALLVRKHHDFDPERFIAASDRTAEGYGSYLGSQLRKPDVIVLVAEENGEVLGYTYAGIEGYDYMALRGPAGVLYDIVVDPAHRDRASAACCSMPTLAALAAKGAPRVVLSTAETQ